MKTENFTFQKYYLNFYSLPQVPLNKNDKQDDVSKRFQNIFAGKSPVKLFCLSLLLIAFA